MTAVTETTVEVVSVAMAVETQKFTDVFSYLHSNEYPSNADKARKRSIRRTSSLFELRDGEVLLKGTRRRWIADKEQQKMILKAYHADPLGKNVLFVYIYIVH